LGKPTEMRNEKILMIGPSLDCQGGIAAVSGMLYDYFIYKNFQVYYLASTVEGIFLKRFLYTLFSYIKFVNFFFTNKLALIHIHCSVYNSFYRKLFYIILAEIIGKKVILQIHPERFDYFYKRNNKYLRNLIKKIFQNLEAIIVLSNSIKSKIAGIFPKVNIYVLNNPVISSNFKCEKLKKRTVVLYLGWIIREKGVYDIVEIIPKVVEKYPSAIFVFCGSKETKKLKSACKNNHCKKNVDINGWITGHEKVNLLSQSTMLVLPSYSEGFPNVLLEAMASCLPIITTPVGANPEIIKDKINGFLISPGDKESLKEKILLLLRNPKLCKTMGRINQKLVKEKYDIEIVGENLIRIYSQIC